jgi:hypothetical protein
MVLMTSNRRGVSARYRVSLAARVLSAVDVPATAIVPLLLFVVPAYTTQGGEASFDGRTVTVTQLGSTGRTVFAANPHAATMLLGITAIAIAALLVAIVTAWAGWQPARWLLAALLAPLTIVAVLGLPSIGLFIIPPVAVGWVIFGLCGDRRP